MKAFTSKQVAELCGVDRTTVGNWVRTGKLRAQRSGNKYLFPANDLRLFLESIGQAIPTALTQNGGYCLDFPTMQTCWDYYAKNGTQGWCQTCFVRKNHIEPCFVFHEPGSTYCAQTCATCEYYRKYYFPRIKFIHQINLPAAVFKNLYIWGANHSFEALYGFKAGQAIGVGTESIMHSDSVERAVLYGKRRTLGDRTIPNHYEANLRIRGECKIAVRVYVSSLNEPEGSFLVIFDPLAIGAS